MWTTKLLAAACVMLIASSGGAETLNLNFNSAGGTVLDKDGQGTGFTSRLANTGTALPTIDTRLDLNVANGTLAITTGTTNEDFNGQSGLSGAEALGISLSSLGYTGTENFQVTASFLPFSSFEAFDQAGIFIGTDSANMIRAGHITFGSAEYFATNTVNGQDVNGRFFGFGFNPADGMNVSISRFNGNWDVTIDGLRWFPNTNPDGTGQPAPPLFLNSASDLTVGVYAVNVANDTPMTYLLDNFQASVTEPCLFDDPGGSCTPTLEHFEMISDHMFQTVIPGLNGDFTLDGFVDYADFRYWKDHYDALPLVASQTIPEPIAMILIFPGFLMVMMINRSVLMHR